MRLASVKDFSGTAKPARDGRLLVVHPDGSKLARLPQNTYPSLMSALEDWDKAEPFLREVESKLISGKWTDCADSSQCRFLAPLPRSYAFLDGSAFVQHIVLVRKARGAELPEDLYTIPLMYQGASDNLLGPEDDVPLIDEAHGMDFEGEVAVLLSEVPMGTGAREAAPYVKLLVLLNDISLRNLIPRELATSFGFFHGKPPSSFAPFAVTPDELEDSWQGGRVHLNIECSLNEKLVGNPQASEMHFSFYELIEHAAKTRPLSAGTILGSGTISNKDQGAGVACLAERRMLEKINSGEIKTPFMKWGDVVEIDMKRKRRSVFGKIRNKIVRY